MTSSVASRPNTIVTAQVPSWSTDSDIGVRKTATADLPSAEYTAVVLARAVVEVLSGRRSVDQLSLHCAPEVHAGLLLQLPSGPRPLPHLMTVRVCEPADGAAEVSAVFRRGGQVYAVAFRLQGLDGRWRITALELG